MVRVAIDTELLCTEVYVLNFKVYYIIYIIHIINLKTKLSQGLRPARLYVSCAIQISNFTNLGVIIARYLLYRILLLNRCNISFSLLSYVIDCISYYIRLENNLIYAHYNTRHILKFQNNAIIYNNIMYIILSILPMWRMCNLCVCAVFV